jgi:vacuolar iron transporter family protein
MKNSIKVGLDFSITSAIITTLGLMVGLNASTQSTIIVIGGLLTIAIADSMSDALGIHIAQEGNKKISHKEVWESTLSAFLGKFFIVILLIMPIIFLGLANAVIINVTIGLFVIGYISYKMALERKDNVIHKVVEHLVITIMVIVLTQIAGTMIGLFL